MPKIVHACPPAGGLTACCGVEFLDLPVGAGITLNADDVTCDAAPTPVIDAAFLARQREWSETTFGPGARLQGILAHIRKELGEIEADPTDTTEWIDVVILALDGAWRAGAAPQQIIDTLVGKMVRNEARTWPDWREFGQDQAIEHVRATAGATA